jgi:hypothetical protein
MVITITSPVAGTIPAIIAAVMVPMMVVPVVWVGAASGAQCKQQDKK